MVFPVGAALVYLARHAPTIFRRESWKRLHPLAGSDRPSDRRAMARPGDAAQSALFRLHAAQRPWRNTTAFFWFFFINEQLLRFLNLRYPRDYNTVPRLYFWVLHLVWLFPWSVYLPGGREAVVQTDRPRGQRAFAGALLGGLRACFLHVFDHAGILFDAAFTRRSRCCWVPP